MVNADGFEVASEEISIESYRGDAVNLFEPEIDPQGSQVTLRWTRFAGGRFVAYRVERFSLDVLEFEEIGRVTDGADTLFVDPDPVPEVPRYRIVVEAFLSYEIRRRISGESAAETLGTISDEMETSFVDTGVEGRLYVYSVVVRISTSGADRVELDSGSERV